MDIAVSGLVDGLAQLIPQFARRILHVGLTSDALAKALHTRSGAEVTGIQCTNSLAEDPVHPGVSGFPRGHDGESSDGKRYEAIIMETGGLGGDALRTLVRQYAPVLTDDGFMLFVVIHLPGSSIRHSESFIGTIADEAGLAFYTTNELAPVANSGGEKLGVRDEQPRAGGFLLWAVRPTYNPLLHARRLFKEGHPGWAYEVLDLVPDRLVEEPELRGAYYGERLMCLLAWDKLADPAGRLGRFFNAQSMFYEATWNTPEAPLPYLCQSEFWRRLGDADMAARLLRTARHVTALPEIDRRLENLGECPRPQCAVEPPPAWREPEHLPRVLFILPARPHYGLDVLYEGLCSVLGDENVVDFPWKDTLHGHVPRELANYPCMFDRRGEPWSLAAITTALGRGEFDLILMGDVEQHVGHEAIRSIVAAAGDLPVYIVDEQDDPLNSYSETLAFMGCESVCGYFKREMLACHDYGARARPLPFAYADRKVPEVMREDRNNPLFWAGHRQFGVRRLYVERLERQLGMKLNRTYSQHEYTEALQASRIGLNLFGFGFDTVRYWELAAHGCMILSERLPICIPHNFVDGESAVFFDDLRDMEEKLDHYLARSEEAAAIARRGHDVFLLHHTASARVRQMLGYAEELRRIASG